MFKGTQEKVRDNNSSGYPLFDLSRVNCISFKEEIFGSKKIRIVKLLTEWKTAFKACDFPCFSLKDIPRKGNKLVSPIAMLLSYNLTVDYRFLIENINWKSDEYYNFSLWKWCSLFIW